MSKKFFLVLIALGLIARQSHAQSSQSTIFDAITLLNMTHGVDALVVPVGPYYSVINPVTGDTIMLESGQPIPAKYLNNDDLAKSILALIFRRNAGLPTTATDSTVKAAYAGNPFFTDLTVDGFVANKAGLVSDAVYTTVGTANVPAAAGALPGNLLGNLVNGTADFLIKRAEQELAVSVFSKLQTLMARYPEFGILFPSTSALIAKVESYDFSNMLTALQFAIQTDLKGLVGNVAGLYQLPKYQALNKQYPPLTLVFSASTLIKDIDGKNNIAQSLADLGGQNFLTGQQNNYASVVRLVCLLSNSLRESYVAQINPQKFGYVSPGELDGYAHKSATDAALLAKYYAGLVYQQLAGINFTRNGVLVPVQSIILNWTNGNQAFLKDVYQGIAHVNSIDSLLAILKTQDEKQNNNSAGSAKHIQRYALYAQLTGQALAIATPFFQQSHAPVDPLLVELNTYWTPLTTETIDVMSAVDEKNYDVALQNLSDLLGTVAKFLDAIQQDDSQNAALVTAVKGNLKDSSNVLQQKIDDLQKVINGLPQANAATSPELARNMKATALTLNDSLKKLQAVGSSLKTQMDDGAKGIYNLSTILKYASLLASIAQAQNGDQVESLLESAALPAGSSRIKKVTCFNIAVNAYVGGFARGGMAGSGFTNRYGLTAPIGFTFSHGFDECGSISLFAGVFDIGNVIQYKLNNQGAYEQNISLAGIVSPSVQLAYGFPWYLPLSIGLGCQWTSPVTNTTNNIQLTGHFNAFIGVDIPLFNLTVVQKKQAAK